MTTDQIGTTRIVGNCDCTSMILKGWTTVHQYDAGNVLMRYVGRIR